MKNLKHYLAIGAFALMILSLPAIASAQWRNDDDYYGNNRNGNYGHNSNLQQAVRDLKYRTRNFERQTDRYDDNDQYGNGGYGGYGNNRRGDRIEDLADDLAKAASRLEKEFGRGRNLNNSRDEAQRVVQIASQVANTMGRGGRNNNNYNSGEWYAIDNNVRVIANAYGLNYNPRGVRNNRGTYGNGRQTNRNLPSWWPF